MNYFGHAAVAGRRSSEPAFVFGAMLPDLLGMCSISDSGHPPGLVGKGVRFHQATDAAFHQSTVFSRENRDLLLLLREAGIRRGPARAAAHVGVEMLIDAALLEQGTSFATYAAALAWFVEEKNQPAPGTHLWDHGPGEHTLRGLCRHLLSRGPAAFSPAPDRLAFRIGRTLMHRPKLRPTQSELTLIGQICAQATSRIEGVVPELLAELSALWLQTPEKECRSPGPPFPRPDKSAYSPGHG